MEKAKIIYNGNVNLEKVNVDSGINFFDESPMQKVIADASKKIAEEQERLIILALKEKVGIALDPKEEAKRRFPRLHIENRNQETTYWWNDGTVEGIRLITFYYDPPKIGDDNTFFTAFKYR